MSLSRRFGVCMDGRRPVGDGSAFEIVELTLAELTSGGDSPDEGFSPTVAGSNLPALGVFGRLSDFAGPDGTSSALRLARSTVSRNVIAASKFVRQYAASPSILLS